MLTSYCSYGVQWLRIAWSKGSMRLGASFMLLYKVRGWIKFQNTKFSCSLSSILFIHDDLVMWGLVWLRMVWFRAILLGTSYARWHLLLHSSSYGNGYLACRPARFKIPYFQALNFYHHTQIWLPTPKHQEISNSISAWEGLILYRFFRWLIDWLLHDIIWFIYAECKTQLYTYIVLLVHV